MQVVAEGVDADIEVALGSAPSINAPVKILISMCSDGMIVGQKSVSAGWSGAPRFNERICACYAAGAVIAREIDRDCPDPFRLAFDDLGNSRGNRADRV